MKRDKLRLIRDTKGRPDDFDVRIADKIVRPRDYLRRAMPEKYTRSHSHERVQAVERMKRAWAAERDALLIVRNFNARLSANSSAGFWPTISTALTSKHPWLVVLCDSCGTVTDLDLRMKPRDPEASIRVALRDVRCPRCNGHGRPRIIALAQQPSV